MPRLRDTRTGVIVAVDDATAESLGSAYETVKEQPVKAAPKKAADKKSD